MSVPRKQISWSFWRGSAALFVIPIPLRGGKAIGNPFTRIYIDDRTLVSRDPAVLAIALTSWSDRALAVGLRENMDKAVAIAKGTACFRHLTQRFTVSQATLLGVTVGSSATRGDSDKEKAQIAACLKIIRLLACNGFPFHRFMDAVRMFAVRKLSCGWLTRMPTWVCCETIWSAVSRGSRRMHAASSWLRGVLWGGNCHPDVACAARLFGLRLGLAFTARASTSHLH